jgi:hypothetical protein
MNKYVYINRERERQRERKKERESYRGLVSLYAQEQADSRGKTHFSSKRKKREQGQKSSRRSADVVGRVPGGGVRGVRHESISSDARIC